MNIKTATFALLAATAAAVPLRAVDTTITAAPEPATATEVTTMSWKTRTEGLVEACVMPTGCVDEAKYNTITERLPPRATPPPLPPITVFPISPMPDIPATQPKPLPMPEPWPVIPGPGGN